MRVLRRDSRASQGVTRCVTGSEDRPPPANRFNEDALRDHDDMTVSGNDGLGSLKRIVLGVLNAVGEYVPDEVEWSQENPPIVFALASLRRMADLLDAELTLALLERHSVTRVLGRSILEHWLNANELLLDGDSAIDRLWLEEADHQHRLERGRELIWERVEEVRNRGLDLRNPEHQQRDRQSPNLADVALRVRELRKQRDFGGDIDEVSYELNYRWDSVQDVHATIDVIFRYLELDTTVVKILRQPNPDDVTALRGPLSVRQDALLVADVLGIYLDVVDRADDLARLRVSLGPRPDQ